MFIVKLNEYALKRGFLQVFGKPLFGYLHDYRLEQARQLLETGEITKTNVLTPFHEIPDTND
ncbi:MAG: hypothetical protein V7L29_14540 [Nostoc sp.]|uniref:hypothetical protein n=1 Tax=Nostoc sp. TaxID=1180 RepID=UPI002FF82680